MNSVSSIYFDYHTTAPTDPRVSELVLHQMLTTFGNASSIDHCFGDEAEEAINHNTKSIADLINSAKYRIIHTSRATESINLPLQGSLPTDRPHKIAVLLTEHKAALDTCAALSRKGKMEIVYLRVNHQGQLDLDHLEELCSTGLSLISIMAANNEVGTIYPIQVKRFHALVEPSRVIRIRTMSNLLRKVISQENSTW